MRRSGRKEFVTTLAAVDAPAHPDTRHRAVPGDRLPELRDGRDPRRLSSGGRRARCPTVDSTSASIAPDDADRALLLWVNSPNNPTGALDDLDAAAAWGRAHGVPVFSDECYVEFTWAGRPRTILEGGSDGVVAVHSLSKRSNLAGLRVGFYAGDAELVTYLQEVRKHVGMMVPGPGPGGRGRGARRRCARRGAARALPLRLELLAGVLGEWSGSPVPLPDGAFYLWIPVDDGWAYTERLARDGGALVSPGEFYGDDGRSFVRAPSCNPTIGSNWSPIDYEVSR